MGGRLHGKRVLITGASGGLGAALALECARRGAKLVLAGRDLKSMGAVARRCLVLGAAEARFYKADVVKAGDCRALGRKLGRDGIDVLVNNAGVHFLAPVESMPEAELKKAFETNFFGPLRLIQASLPGMRRRGGGLIVQIGSTLAWRSIPMGGGYAATKAAFARLSESLRMELEGSGVRVLQADPGVILTRLRERAYAKGLRPEPQAKLPFPRSAERTAFEIVEAMEAGRRDLMSAAWPVKFTMKFLAVYFPGFVDKMYLRSGPAKDKVDRA